MQLQFAAFAATWRGIVYGTYLYCAAKSSCIIFVVHSNSYHFSECFLSQFSSVVLIMYCCALRGNKQANWDQPTGTPWSGWRASRPEEMTLISTADSSVDGGAFWAISSHPLSIKQLKNRHQLCFAMKTLWKSYWVGGDNDCYNEQAVCAQQAMRMFEITLELHAKCKYQRKRIVKIANRCHHENVKVSRFRAEYCVLRAWSSVLGDWSMNFPKNIPKEEKHPEEALHYTTDTPDHRSIRFEF